MRKLLAVIAIVAAVGLVAVDARAELGSELEVSGNVTTVSGWQRANSTGSTRANPVRGGVLADDLSAIGANGTNTFGFYVDQLEVDLAKSFGENIRIRGDLDFTPGGPGKGNAFAGGTGDVGVEQAYVTANIPAGNGAELLIGRFNSGIGSDPVDRNELSTVSFGMPHRVLLPHNLTGVRLGYNFNESTRGELFVVNDLGDRAIGTNSMVPSGGFNLVYAWGEYATPSWVKLTGAIGPELASNRNYTFLGDLAASWAVNDAFAVGLEGLYRQDNNLGAGSAAFLGGQLSGTYGFSDVWDGTLRYSYIWDLDSSDADATGVGGTNELTGAPGLTYSGQNHEVTLATGYMITDGARFGLEGRVDLAKASAGGSMGFGFGVAGMFAYSF